MARIAVGGFQHETNTFAPCKTPFEEFKIPGGWPPMTRGPDLFETVSGTSVPIAGAIEAATDAGHDLVGLSWCMATPANRVTDDAFERISAMLLAELDTALAEGPLDGVYLDLHGAAVTESLEDAEGELIARVRRRVGAAVPIAVSVDLHANLTDAMVRDADLIDAYRHYPHIDMRVTGARAMRGLLARIGDTGPWHRRFRKFPFLIAINWQCTLIEPGRTILDHIDDLGIDEDVSICFCPGFPLADIADCGPALAVFGRDEARVSAVFDTIDRLMLKARPAFAGEMWSPTDAIAYAIAAEPAPKPFVFADTQDNPGGGGEADTTGILQALIDADARDALMAIIKDPDAAAAAHKAGIGATLTLDLGAGTLQAGIVPVRGQFTVERLTDGNTVGTGPMQRGNALTLGPTALLRIGGVRVIVTSRKAQVADQAVIRHTGIDPMDMRIIVVKSSVHFRAAFQPIAREVLVVKAPGPVTADLTQLPFRNLRAGVDLSP